MRIELAKEVDAIRRTDRRVRIGALLIRTANERIIQTGADLPKHFDRLEECLRMICSEPTHHNVRDLVRLIIDSARTKQNPVLADRVISLIAYRLDNLFHIKDYESSGSWFGLVNAHISIFNRILYAGLFEPMLDPMRMVQIDEGEEGESIVLNLVKS